MIRGYKISKSVNNVIQVLRTTQANKAPLLKYDTIHTASYGRSLEVVVARAWNLDVITCYLYILKVLYICC